MSHIPYFDEELIAVEALMQKSPDKHMDFTIHDADPRDVPEGYEQTNCDTDVYFEKKIGKSEIVIWIDKGWVNKGCKASLKSF